MKWYEKQYEIDGSKVCLLGTFVESEVRIDALIKLKDQPNPEFKIVKLYGKPVSMWAHQEILAEDILSKFQGMIRKYENKLPALVERYKLDERI